MSYEKLLRGSDSPTARWAINEIDALRAELATVQARYEFLLRGELALSKARVEELESLINRFCEASSWADQGWKDEPHTSPLFDVYEKWKKPSANTIERKMVTEEARDE